jgi:hypothetical protein
MLRAAVTPSTPLHVLSKNNNAFGLSLLLNLLLKLNRIVYMKHRLHLTLLLFVFTQSSRAAFTEPPSLLPFPHTLPKNVIQPLARLFPIFFAVINQSTVPISFSCPCGSMKANLKPNQPAIIHWFLPSLIESMDNETIINMHRVKVRAKAPNACTMRVITNADGTKGLCANNKEFKLVWHYPDGAREKLLDYWFSEKTISTPLNIYRQDCCGYLSNTTLTVSCIIVKNKDGSLEAATGVTSYEIKDPIFFKYDSKTGQTRISMIVKCLIAPILPMDN